MDYQAFLNTKRQSGADSGFDPVWLPDFLFDFQKVLVEWSIRKGRDAIFADCGLGKTPMQLVWAENVVRKHGRVLILAPLAVSAQTQREADKFGIDSWVSRDGFTRRDITITNYQRLHYFDPADYAGVVCDESSILKSFDGATRTAITAFMRKVPYRLLCTATAAPNDYIELGTSSEALGYLRHAEMLPMYFIHDGGETQKWHLKGHAVLPFWRWVCSWARACRKPSDMGFEDDGFILPPLQEREHVLKVTDPLPGMLFPMSARTLDEQRAERRQTINERCEQVAALVNDTGKPALVWCHLNAEGDLLAKLIPDSVQVAGSDTDDAKEERLLAFADGKVRVLVTKPKIGAWGMNFQHCSHVTFFPSHSFEQYYQGVRRCWRFGQKNPVLVDIVTTEGERGVLANLQRKATQADRMFSHLVAEMNMAIATGNGPEATIQEEVPPWLSTIN
jgi:hypothetical protein